MDSKDKQAPTLLSSESVSIHLQYITRDLQTITKHQEENAIETKRLLKEIKDGVPTRFEFNELVKEVLLKAEAAEVKNLREILTQKADLESVRTLKDAVENKLVTKEDFAPVKKFVYATIALVLTTVGIAILALVIK